MLIKLLKGFVLKGGWKQYLYNIRNLLSIMVRRGAVALLGAFVVLFLVVASWPIFAYEKNTFSSGFTGNSVREAVGDFYETSSVSKRIFILAQFLLLIVIVVAAIIVLSKFRSKEKISKASFMEKGLK